MNNLNLSKKTKLLVGLFVVLIFILSMFFLITYQPKSEPTTTNPTALPSISTYINSPNQFAWQIDLLKLPSEVTFISTKPNTKGKETLTKLAQNLEFKDKPTTIPNTPIIIYNNLSEATSIYLNTDENVIQFNLDLSTRPNLAQTNPKTPPQISQDTLVFLEKNLQLPPPVTLTKTSSHYQTTNGPRFVTTTPDKAKFIKSTYNYSINSLPLLFPKGNSIETIHTLSGQPVKFTINLPFNSLQQLKNYQVKTIEEIKSTPQSQFITIMLKGNEKFTLSDQEVDLGTTTITNGFLGYIVNQNSNNLEPFIFLTGTTNHVQYGQLELLLGIPALSSTNPVNE